MKLVEEKNESKPERQILDLGGSIRVCTQGCALPPTDTYEATVYFARVKARSRMCGVYECVRVN